MSLKPPVTNIAANNNHIKRYNRGQPWTILYQLSIFTWLVCNLLTVAVHGFSSNELDPVLDLSNSGIHTLAGTLESKANHANLGESK